MIHSELGSIMSFKNKQTNKQGNDPSWAQSWVPSKAEAIAYEAKLEKAKLDWQDYKNSWRR